MNRSVSRIEDWFEALPEEWRSRAQQVRRLLLEASPLIRENWKYNTPFYDHRTWLCYLSQQKGGLILGFVQGIHLLDPEGLLEHTDHKQIRHFRLPAEREQFDEKALGRLVLEAVLVNDELVAQRQRGHRRPSK